MEAKKIMDMFKARYPGRNIVSLPKEKPTEIICEIDPSSEHPEYNVAVAAIRVSAPHYHKKAVEIYKVKKGSLKLYVDGKLTILKPGESYTVNPGCIHYAEGNYTLVEVTSKPGWTEEDHYLV